MVCMAPLDLQIAIVGIINDTGMMAVLSADVCFVHVDTVVSTRYKLLPGRC